MNRPRTEIKVYVSPAERKEIERRAAAAHLSISEYLRTAGLNLPVRSVLDANAAKELAILNGHFGKLREFLNEFPGDERFPKILQDLQKQSHDIMGRILR